MSNNLSYAAADAVKIRTPELGPLDWNPDRDAHALIVGAPGTGKTTLLESIAAESRSKGWRVALFPDLNAAHPEPHPDRDEFLNTFTSELYARYDQIESGEATRSELTPAIFLIDNLTAFRSAIRQDDPKRRGAADGDFEAATGLNFRHSRAVRLHIVIADQHPVPDLAFGSLRDCVSFRIDLGSRRQADNI